MTAPSAGHAPTDRVARALAHVRALAAAAPVSGRPDDVTTAALRSRARVTVSFHPDRPGRGGSTAARGLAADGVYRSQFETGTSSGGLDHVIDGARSRWERAMFGGAYDDAPPAVRPRYGGLDLVGYPDGACPRFGSTHLVLRPEVLERCTFSWGDSVTEPTAVGTWDELRAVLAAAAAEDAPELRGRPRPRPDRLDHCVETQVHGGLTTADVGAVVTDPAYRGTAVEHDLRRACDGVGIALTEHAGYHLPVDLDPGFRGDAAVRLAAEVHDRLGTRAGLDPELLGRAAADVVAHPDAWAAHGDPTTVLQGLKHVWHHLAAFGYRDDGTAVG